MTLSHTASKSSRLPASGNTARRQSGSLLRGLLAMGGESGQAVLEMAFAVPLFLAVVFGIFQSSIVMLTYCSATYACRNAARYASLHSSTSLVPSACSDINTMVQNGLFLSSSIHPTVNVQYSVAKFNSTAIPPFAGACVAGANDPTDNIPGNLVWVQATWTQTMLIPFMPTSSFSVGTQTFRTITR